jgi:3-phenylpropionate/trans-cinnamate dioxygenase ferredoxin reductase component
MAIPCGPGASAGQQHERRFGLLRGCCGTWLVPGWVAAGWISGVGEVLAAQMVIVAIGIVLAVKPLLAAGGEGGNGVKVDAQCRTALLHVFAISDCAFHANTVAEGASIRLESVQNANDLAAVMAKAITGQEMVYHAAPWL